MSTKYDVTCSQNGLLNCYDKKYEKIPFDNIAVQIKQISASNLRQLQHFREIHDPVSNYSIDSRIKKIAPKIQNRFMLEWKQILVER